MAQYGQHPCHDSLAFETSAVQIGGKVNRHEDNIERCDAMRRARSILMFIMFVVQPAYHPVRAARIDNMQQNHQLSKRSVMTSLHGEKREERY